MPSASYILIYYQNPKYHNFFILKHFPLAWADHLSSDACDDVSDEHSVNRQPAKNGFLFEVSQHTT
jgi:hypothetical protein